MDLGNASAYIYLQITGDYCSLWIKRDISGKNGKLKIHRVVELSITNAKDRPIEKGKTERVRKRAREELSAPRLFDLLNISLLLLYSFTHSFSSLTFFYLLYFSYIGYYRTDLHFKPIFLQVLSSL
jgi:hypothetical protein